MDFSYFITLSILSSGLIFYSFLLGYAIILESDNYKINSSKELLKTWLVILGLGVSIIGLFLWRYWRRNYSFDVIANVISFCDRFDYYNPINIIFASLFMFILLIFWILFLMFLYKKINLASLKLFLYYYCRYPWLEKLGLWITLKEVSYIALLLRPVMSLTKNKKIHNLAIQIWPVSFEILERNFVVGFLPYLILFDFQINDGVLTKIFLVMPWFFLYCFLRNTFFHFYELQKAKNCFLSYEIYGF